MVDVFHLSHVLSVLYVLRPLSMFSDLYSCSPIQYCEIPQFVEPCPRLVSKLGKIFHKNREKNKSKQKKNCQSEKQMPVKKQTNASQCPSVSPRDSSIAWRLSCLKRHERVPALDHDFYHLSLSLCLFPPRVDDPN